MSDSEYIVPNIQDLKNNKQLCVKWLEERLAEIDKMTSPNFIGCGCYGISLLYSWIEGFTRLCYKGDLKTVKNIMKELDDTVTPEHFEILFGLRNGFFHNTAPYKSQIKYDYKLLPKQMDKVFIVSEKVSSNNNAVNVNDFVSTYTMPITGSNITASDFDKHNGNTVLSEMMARGEAIKPIYVRNKKCVYISLPTLLNLCAEMLKKYAKE